jgi:hypothetical protein
MSERWNNQWRLFEFTSPVASIGSFQTDGDLAPNKEFQKGTVFSV